MLPVKEERRCQAAEACENKEQEANNHQKLDLEVVKQILAQTAAREERAGEQSAQMMQTLLTAMQQNAATASMNFKETFTFMAQQSANFQKLQFEQQKTVMQSIKEAQAAKAQSFGNVLKAIGAIGDVAGKITSQIPNIINSVKVARQNRGG